MKKKSLQILKDIKKLLNIRGMLNLLIFSASNKQKEGSLKKNRNSNSKEKKKELNITKQIIFG